MVRGAQISMTMKSVRVEKNASTKTVQEDTPGIVDTSLEMEGASLVQAALTATQRKTTRTKLMNWKRK